MPVPFTILLVDDDPDISDVMTRAARHSFPEAQIFAVFSFSEAVRYLDGLTGFGPRLVLLDVNLQSEHTGLDFLKLWRQHPQGRLIPIIILSADLHPIDCSEAYRWGVNSFTLKPFSYDGWKDYAYQLREYWYRVTTIPRLRFEGTDTAASNELNE